MSLVEVYWRTLTYLSAARGKVAVICGSNVLLAIVAIVVVSLHRAGPGAVTRVRDTIRHPVRYLRERPADQSSTSA